VILGECTGPHAGALRLYFLQNQPIAEIGMQAGLSRNELLELIGTAEKRVFAQALQIWQTDPSGDSELHSIFETALSSLASKEPILLNGFSLYHKKGQSVEEVAIQMEVPVRVVKTILFFAENHLFVATRTHLRKMLAAQESWKEVVSSASPVLIEPSFEEGAGVN